MTHTGPGCWSKAAGARQRELTDITREVQFAGELEQLMGRIQETSRTMQESPCLASQEPNTKKVRQRDAGGINEAHGGDGRRLRGPTVNTKQQTDGGTGGGAII